MAIATLIAAMIATAAQGAAMIATAAQGAAMMVAAAAQGSLSDAPRKAFVGCLKQSVDKAQGDKIAAGSFAAVARTACAGQLESFRSGLVSWDVKAGTPRGRAEADADAQIDDYLTGAAEKLEPGS